MDLCVFCRYDYSGYGQSTGKVRDLNIYMDLFRYPENCFFFSVMIICSARSNILAVVNFGQQ